MVRRENRFARRLIMKTSTKKNGRQREHPPSEISTAKAFYLVFRALPEADRLAVARYILQDEEIQRRPDVAEVPNDTTLDSFAENKVSMPAFKSLEELRRDLLS